MISYYFIEEKNRCRDTEMTWQDQIIPSERPRKPLVFWPLNFIPFQYVENMVSRNMGRNSLRSNRKIYWMLGTKRQSHKPQIIVLNSNNWQSRTADLLISCYCHAWKLNFLKHSKYPGPIYLLRTTQPKTKNQRLSHASNVGKSTVNALY